MKGFNQKLTACKVLIPIFFYFHTSLKQEVAKIVEVKRDHAWKGVDILCISQTRNDISNAENLFITKL